MCMFCRSLFVFSGVRVTRYLVWCVCFVDRCLSFFLLVMVLSVLYFWSWCCLSFCLLVMVLSVLLSFGHGVVCPSVFWSWCCLSFCLLVMVLSVLFRFADSEISYYPFGIFKLFLKDMLASFWFFLGRPCKNLLPTNKGTGWGEVHN
jgi:hypothetical protein